MHNHLGKLGFSKTERLEIAKHTLNRRIVTFTQLDENEALEVWNAARRTASSRARAREELRAASVIGQAPVVTVRSARFAQGLAHASNPAVQAISDEEAKAILN